MIGSLSSGKVDYLCMDHQAWLISVYVPVQCFMNWRTKKNSSAGVRTFLLLLSTTARMTHRGTVVQNGTGLLGSAFRKSTKDCSPWMCRGTTAPLSHRASLDKLVLLVSVPLPLEVVWSSFQQSIRVWWKLVEQEILTWKLLTLGKRDLI